MDPISRISKTRQSKMSLSKPDKSDFCDVVVHNRKAYRNTVHGEKTHQDALVHVSIVAELHADPDDAGVIHLPVVEGE